MDGSIARIEFSKPSRRACVKTFEAAHIEVGWKISTQALGPRDVAYAADVVYPATPPAAVDALFASARAAVGASGVFVLSFVVRGARLPERLFAAAAAAGCGARVLDGAAAAAPCGATVFEFAFAGGGDLEACARRAYPGIWAPERDDGDAPSSDDEWMPFAGEAAADALW